MSWKRLEDIFKKFVQDEYIGLDQDVLKTSPEDIELRRIYPPWSRRWRSREDEGKRRLQDVFIKINVFWVCLFFLLLLLLLFFCLVYSLKLSISTFWFICSSNRSFSVITPLQISLRKELIVLNFEHYMFPPFCYYLYRSFGLSFCFFLIHLLVYIVKSILKITDWFYLLFSVFKVYKDFAWFWDVPPIAFLCFPKAFPKGE